MTPNAFRVRCEDNAVTLLSSVPAQDHASDTVAPFAEPRHFVHGHVKGVEVGPRNKRAILKISSQDRAEAVRRFAHWTERVEAEVESACKRRERGELRRPGYRPAILQ